MLKYCFIKDEKTGLVQIGVGCPDEYYIEIGMQQRYVEQSEIDYQWYLTEKCPHYTQEEIQEQKRQYKIQEINSKIAELEQMVTDEILFGNEANIQVYREVIQGLKDTRDNL